MSEIATLLTQGQSRLESLLGTPTFAIGGVSFKCVPSNLMRGTSVAFGGYDVEIALTLIVRTAEIGTTTIKTGTTTISHGGKSYKVGRIRSPAGGATKELDLVDANT